MCTVDTRASRSDYTLLYIGEKHYFLGAQKNIDTFSVRFQTVQSILLVFT